jgi:tetratricopeptide (TPR) repeat protein/thiol-disulfide isomerase/thioredoxin
MVHEWILGGHMFVYFTPDSRALVISRDDEYSFWDVDTLQPIRRLRRDVADYPGYVAFSPDGRLMALEMAPAVIHLKEVATGRTVARLEDPHGDRAKWLGFTPDGTQLVVAATYARAIHIWDLRAIRRQLKALRLDWSWPEFPPAAKSDESRSPHSDPPKIRVLGEALDLAGPTVGGGKFDLKQLRGKVVLIHFWASWCGPCVAEMANVSWVYDRYHKNGLEVVGISLDNSKEALLEFVKAGEVPWTQIFFEGKDTQGWNNPLARRFGINSIPSSMVIDRDGTVAQVGVRGEALGPAVAKLLSTKPTVATPAVPAVQDDKIQQGFQVTAVSLQAVPDNYSGPAPAPIQFRGKITANGPGRVRYTFLRSDGFRGPVFTLTFEKAGVKEVSADWLLGGGKYEGWQALKLLAPNQAVSDKARFAVDLSPTATPQQAIAKYSLEIGFMPLNPEAYLRRGWAYYQLKQWRQAADDLGLALALNPGNTESEFWFDLGYSCAEAGWHNGALAAYSRCIELNPNGRAAWNNRGVLYEKRGELDKAVADFSRAIALDAKYDTAWNNRSRVHASLGRWEKTVEDCTNFLALVQRPRQPEAYYRRAAAYVRLRRYGEAQADYQKLVELAPGSALVHNDLSWFLATCPDPKLRDPARAVQLARRALELQEQVGNNWNTLGVARYRAGYWKAAVQALDRSRAFRKGGDAFDFYFLAMAHWRLGHKEEARKWHQRAIEWVKQNHEALAKDRQHAEELRRFGAEAAELLGIDAKKDG